MSNNSGVTLIELIIVIAIIGIIVLFATVDTAWVQRDARVSEARDRLLADVEEAKLKSLAQVPHAIVIVSASSYKMVKLNDTNNNFKKDTSGTPETTTDIANSTVTLSTNVKVGLTSGTEFWFDRKGVPRTTNWGINGNTFRVWYDEIANGVIDWTEVGALDNENKCNEPCRLIIISNTGRIQYEKR